MLWEFVPGQRLVVQLKKDCYIGDFHYTNKDCTRLELTNVRDFHTNDTFSGIQRYYRSEIQMVTPLQSEVTHTATKKTVNTTESTAACSISASDLDTISESIRTAQYFVHTDRAYHAAVELIKAQQLIGLAVELNLESDVSLLTICVPTSQRVFIFDITLLGNVPSELKAILQAKLPQKIVHNSVSTVLALKRHTHVNLKFIFDTLVAHVALGHAKTHVSLSECLQTHLSLPPALWATMDDFNWISRPLCDERKVIAAQNVAYLSRLHSYLLHDRMLQSFYEQCNVFAGIDRNTEEELGDAYFDLCCNPNAAVRKIAVRQPPSYAGVGSELRQSIAPNEH